MARGLRVDLRPMVIFYLFQIYRLRQLTILCAFIFDSNFLMLLVALYMRRQHMRFSAIYEPRLHERILFVYIYFFGICE